MTEITETNQISFKWFKFNFTEEIYHLLNKPETLAVEAEQWSVLKASAAPYLIEENPRSDIIFELYFQIIQFCCENSFTFDQSYIFLSFVREVFEKSMILNAEGNDMPTPEDVNKLFYDLMMSFLLQERKEGDASKTFSVKEIEMLSTFFSLTFAQNVKAFQYVCKEIQPEIIENRRLSIQTPLVPFPTSAATSFPVTLTPTLTSEDIKEVQMPI